MRGHKPHIVNTSGPNKNKPLTLPFTSGVKKLKAQILTSMRYEEI